MKINRQYSKLKIAYISIAVLVGHFFALIHSVEHPFHETSDSCEIYFVLEQSGNGLVCDCTAIISPIFYSNNPRVDFASLFISYTQNFYHIRAPPFSLLIRKSS